MKKNRAGMTLIELLIALVLFTLIVTGISTFDIFGHFHAITFDRRAALQNELSLTLEHMARTIVGGSIDPSTGAKRGGAVGDIANIPFSVDTDKAGFRVLIDSNNNGRLDENVWAGYRQVNNRMNYYAVDSAPNVGNTHGAVTEVIANHLRPTPGNAGEEGFLIETPVYISTMPLLPAYNGCTITLRSRWDSTKQASMDNPQVEMTATTIAPSVSSY